MTREEAITVLKALYDNPLFGDVHKAAFNIAIHDIKAYHKWNLNELVLTQKDNEQDSILDKIRAEIEDIDEPNYDFEGFYTCQSEVLQIIDKYKTDRSMEDGNDD